MKLTNSLRTLAATCAFAVASHAGAAVLQVNAGGILTGATDINIGGALYRVTFADGSCNSLFNGCTNSAFAFSTEDSASAAAQALLDQVFIDSSAGNFDSVLGKVVGCLNPNNCFTEIPFLRNPANSSVRTSRAFNEGSEMGDRVVQSFNVVHSDSTAIGNNNYAIFELTSPATIPVDVPEPTSIALFGLAMAGLAFNRRRKA